MNLYSQSNAMIAMRRGEASYKVKKLMFFYVFTGNHGLVAKEDKLSERKLAKCLNDYSAKCFLLSK